MAEPTDLKKRKEALESITTKPEVHVDHLREEKSIHELEIDRRNAEIEAREQEDIIQMRRAWSRWLLACIVGLVIFDAIIILSLGLGLMSFAQDYLVPVFIGESLLKIFGLAFIVVEFLFNKNALEKALQD